MEVNREGKEMGHIREILMCHFVCLPQVYGSSYNIKRLSPSIVPLEIQLGRFKLLSYSRIESILFED